MGKESSDSGTQEREDSDQVSHDSRGHSAPTAAEEPTHRTPSMEDAPSDSGARGQRRSAILSAHQQPEQPRPADSTRMGTFPPRRSSSQSVYARLEQARRRKAAARETVVRRRHPLELNQRSVDDAEREDKEASVELTRAAWAAAQQARADEPGAVAPSSPVRVREVHSRSARLGDEAFLDGSVSYMASKKRHEFAAELQTAVVETASALLTSVRRLPFHSPELLSVRQAWSDMDHSSWRGQQEAGPTLALVTALRRAHDATETPVLWPTP